MTWPSDADGDVLRRLEQSGFDFSKSTLIDFNVDFQSWPPPAAAIAALSRHYPSVRAYEPDGEFAGYLQFQVFARVTHELVTNIQHEITDLMSPYDGECSSWGVLSSGQPG
jgi:Regulator of ribonuclease activity B